MDLNSYGNAIGRVEPGTFVPDIAPSKPPASQPLPDGDNESAIASFRDTVKSLLGSVNDKMTEANQKSEDVASGRSNDLTGTVKSVEEAGLAFQFTMAMRNKLMEAYSEVERMQF